MSNAKIISLIAAETRQVRADDERARTALAADLYDALRSMVAPLSDRIEALEADVAYLKLERTNGTEGAETSQGAARAAAQDQGRQGQEHPAQDAAKATEPVRRR
jgi:hypothetical protein